MTDQVTDNEALTSEDATDPTTASKTPWPEDDIATLAHVKSLRRKAENVLGDWYDAAVIDFQFREGKQWSTEDADKLNSENRVAATFNRVGPIINSILGQEVANRQEVKFLPRRIGEVNMADPMNDAVKWVRETCNAEDEDSDAFADMVTCGMGWTVTRMNYEEDPDGIPEVERRDPMLMRWDTAARRKNLADARWVQADYWMDPEAVKDRWPDADIDQTFNPRAPQEHAQPHDASEAWKYKNNASGQDEYEGQMRVIHHVQKYTITNHHVVDPASGQMMKLTQDQHDQVQKGAKTAGVEPPQSVPIKTAVYWQAWTVGGTVLESGEAPAQKAFPYQAMTCYRERETGFWYGVVRMMIDPQRYANRFMSLMMSVLATGPKGGVLYETGAFVNPKRAKADWARHDSAIELSAGALAGGKIQPKPPITMPTGASDLMQFAITSIRDVVGFGPEMLGQSDSGEQNATVEDMRVKAGLVILANVFDAIRLYRKRHGILLCEFVQRFISDGRLIRVIGQNGQQFIPLLRDPQGVEYDIVVDESPTSRDVKDKTWKALQIIMPMAMQAGMPLPNEALDYTPLPQSLVVSWKQQIQQKQQQPPQPPVPVQVEQAKGQNAMQLEQAKQQSSGANVQAEAQKSAIDAQQKSQSEQARMQADVAIATHDASVKAQLAEMKMQYDIRLDAIKNSQAQETAKIIAIIQAISKVESARVTAQVDPGDAFVEAAAYPQ